MMYLKNSLVVVVGIDIQICIVRQSLIEWVCHILDQVGIIGKNPPMVGNR
eukprot:CAMPEP_0172462422 /NCGR_PEP_ID=MMETSP1065-20121228/43827_1 /TAXON_ID=265537 /ORGANISM="Amphiprora paludosa, Strain CCMP125" /LENGTH=49 /DNA_ID= /DNA_START= /DNA_END= /DNA_ORIENTATION=